MKLVRKGGHGRSLTAIVRPLARRAGAACGLALAVALASCEPDSSSPASGDRQGVLIGEEHKHDEVGQRAFEHVRYLVNLGPRLSGSEAYGKQIRYLKEELEKAGWVTKTRSWSVRNPVTGQEVPMTNLYARFGGKGTDFETPLPGLLSCHIDTKTGIEGFVGANDGASGAAVLLETARILASEPETAHGVELVFFDGEESFAQRMKLPDGLYGSTWDAERRGENLPDWMVNLDMVGRRGMQMSVPADETSQEMYEHYMQAIASLGVSRRTWQVALGSIYDDHRPFFERGVHTLNLIDDFGGSDWWHTTSDELSLIAPESLGESVRMALQLVKQLVRDREIGRLSGAKID